MNTHSNHYALLLALVFALSSVAPAFARPEADFHDGPSKSDPIVFTTDTSGRPAVGESITGDGMRDHQADFNQPVASKSDPVVRFDGHRVPQPQGGDNIENNDINNGS